MDEQRLKYLLERYKAGECTTEELAQFNEWYNALHQNGAGFFLSGEDRKEKLNQLLQRINEQVDAAVTAQPRITRRTRTISIRVAAAAVLLLCAGAAWRYYAAPPDKPVAMATTTSEPAKQQDTLNKWTAHSNATGKQITLLLPDSSTARLLPGATVKYNTDFVTGNKRNITITGKVLFDVAKEKNRPFTVYSGRFATTVLGTSFSVNEYKAGADIALFTGKVVVKPAGTIKGWKEDIYLQPGQHMQYLAGTGTVKVMAIENTAVKPVATSLVFEDTPLNEVLDKLSKQYQVTIRYNTADLTAMRFTGTIQSTDSLKVMLHAIAQMNGLSATAQADGFIIQTAH